MLGSFWSWSWPVQINPPEDVLLECWSSALTTSFCLSVHTEQSPLADVDPPVVNLIEAPNLPVLILICAKFWLVTRPGWVIYAFINAYIFNYASGVTVMMFSYHIKILSVWQNELFSSDIVQEWNPEVSIRCNDRELKGKGQRRCS